MCKYSLMGVLVLARSHKRSSAVSSAENMNINFRVVIKWLPIMSCDQMASNYLPLTCSVQ